MKLIIMQKNPKLVTIQFLKPAFSLSDSVAYYGAVAITNAIRPQSQCLTVHSST